MSNSMASQSVTSRIGTLRNGRNEINWKVLQFPIEDVIESKIVHEEQTFAFRTRNKVIAIFKAGNGNSNWQDVTLYNGETTSLDVNGECIYFVTKDGILLWIEHNELPLSSQENVLKSLHPRTGEKYKFVACGSSHVLLRTEKDWLYSFGSGPQVGNDQSNTSPSELGRISGLNTASWIAAGDKHSAAVIRRDQLEQAPGAAEGNGSRARRRRRSRLQVVWRQKSLQNGVPIYINQKTNSTEKLLHFKRMKSKRLSHPVIQSEEEQSFGTVYTVCEGGSMHACTWGNGNDGQLGHGNGNDCKKPTLVQQPCNVVAVACGGQHTVILTVNGEVYISGRAVRDAECNVNPILVKSNIFVIDVVAGEYATLVKGLRETDIYPVIAFLEYNNAEWTFRELQITNVPRSIIDIRCSLQGNYILVQMDYPQSAARFLNFQRVFCSKCVKTIKDINGLITSLQKPLTELHATAEKDSKKHCFSKGLCEVLNTMKKMSTFIFHLIRKPILQTACPFVTQELDKELYEDLRVLKNLIHEFVAQLNNFLLFSGFSVLKSFFRKLDFAGSSSSDSFERKFMGILAIKDVLKSFVESLQQEFSGQDHLAGLYQDILKNSAIYLEWQCQRQSLCKVLLPLHSNVRTNLYDINDRILLVSGTSRNSDQVVPLTIIQSSKQKYNNYSLILQEKHLALYHNETVMIWKLQSVWIDTDNNLEKMTITLPEITFEVTAKGDDFKIWSDKLSTSLKQAFHEGSSLHSSLDWRELKHCFYDGNFKDCVYDGEWYKGMPHGYGILQYAGSDDTYVGEWKTGNFCGLGVQTTHGSDGNVTIYQGMWSAGKRHGFGRVSTFQKRKDPSGEVSLTQECYHFTGNLKEGQRSGCGIEVKNDEATTIGQWIDDKLNGEATVIGPPDNSTNMVLKCTYKNGNLATNRAEVRGIDYYYVGMINKEFCPYGDGVYLTNGMKFAGRIEKLHRQDLYIAATVTKSSPPVSNDHVFKTQIGSDPQRACSKELFNMCLSAFANQDSGTLPTEELRAKFTTLNEPPDCSATVGSLTLSTWIDLQTWLQKLSRAPNSPLSVLIDICVDKLMCYATLEIADSLFLQELCIEELNVSIRLIYQFIRELFPHLHDNVLELKELTDGPRNEKRSGLDLVYSCLSENFYGLLEKILLNPCQNIDNLFRTWFYGMDTAEAAAKYICTSAEFDSLKNEMVMIFDNSEEGFWRPCVQKLEEFSRTEVDVSKIDSLFRILGDLEEFMRIFDRKFHERDCPGEDSSVILLSCIICKVKPMRFSYRISVLEKLTNHRSTENQKDILRKLHKAYGNCCENTHVRNNFLTP